MKKGVRLAGMRKSGVLLLLVFLFTSPDIWSQSGEMVELGRSAVTLPGPWKFAPGDSPMVNGSPVWAQPDFDDSKWVSMDVAPTDGSVDPAFGTAGFVPGWTKQGFPELAGYAWYRLRLRVKDNGQRLSIKMPDDVDDAYQIYGNGQYVGEFGKFSPQGVTIYSSRTFSFPLPAPGPDRMLVLAVRFYMTPTTRFQSPDAGGMHQPPAIGLASTMRLLQASEEDANLHYYLGGILQSLLFLLVLPLAVWGWLQDRRDRTYFWLCGALVLSILRYILLLMGNLGSLISLGVQAFWMIAVIGPLILLCWIMFWWHWFALKERRWIQRVAWILTGMQMLVLTCLRGPTWGWDLVPRSWLPAFDISSAILLGLLNALLIVILIEGLRRDRTEALAAALPILMVAFSSFGVYLLGTYGIPEVVVIFGVGMNAGAVGLVLMIVVIGFLVLRRFLRMQVDRELARQTIGQELEQAQQLQQRVLVPEKINSRFFSVETEYRPAQTVGGDFFQTIAKPDGSLMVVIGDVSGKGVSAAMLVAVLVGAAGARADESSDPASMLAVLNHRLAGRSGGHFATCLVAEISPDGTMRIANAGHLPPYLNGKEMALEGSLPLGVVAGSEPSVQVFKLQPGDRLTFVTDGVVEATNPAKELFGFERTRDISHEKASAIADKARAFGQNDDITVLAVSYAGAV
jgi:hypothetical protein